MFYNPNKVIKDEFLHKFLGKDSTKNQSISIVLKKCRSFAGLKMTV